MTPMKMKKKPIRKSSTKSPRERLSSRQKSLPDRKSAFGTPGKSLAVKEEKTVSKSEKDKEKKTGKRKKNPSETQFPDYFLRGARLR